MSFKFIRVYLSIFVFWLFAPASTVLAGGIATGGGDPCEERIQIIRDDLHRWISSDGHRNSKNPLQFSNGESVELYTQKMLEMTAVKKLDDRTFQPYTYIECQQEEVKVQETQKVCRFDKKISGPKITCDSNTFLKLTEDQQYRLIHHEFAGLTGFELPQGSQSRYDLSNQIVARLESQTVKRLPVVTSHGICDRSQEIQEILLRETHLTNCHEVSSEDLAQITGSQGASFFYIREFHQSPRPGDFDGLSNVNSIRFDFAPAAGFEPGAFRGLTSLETLWLGGGGAQKMAALNPGAFEGLSQLKSLSITASEVTQIPAGAFDGLTYLTSFGLDLPNLQEIEPGAFANLRYAGIHIPCQKLEKIIVGIFKDYAGPRITFCDNQKAPMPANIFMGTKKVQTLKLDLNGSTIDPEIFNGLSKVESLDLFLANAQSLDPRIFSKMPMLKSLSLKSVHPLGLTSETFKYNSLLERVSLSGSYQSFETELFASNPKMNLFDYSGVKIRSNPFNELCNRYKFRIVYGYEVWGAAGHVRFLSCH